MHRRECGTVGRSINPLRLGLVTLALLVVILAACSLVHAGGPSPQRLYQTLLATPVQNGELPAGHTWGGNSAPQLTEVGRVLPLQKEDELECAETGTGNRCGRRLSGSAK